MAKKKVLSLINYKIKKNLGINNELIEGQSRALKTWKKFRKIQPRAASDSTAKDLIKDMVGISGIKTGRPGKKSLNQLKKLRKKGAFALRSTEKRTYGKAKIGGGKDAPNILRALKHNIEGRAVSLKNWKASGAKKDFIKEQESKQKMYKEAKSGLQNRMINARGKGVRFIRKNGRIIPIRPKRSK